MEFKIQKYADFLLLLVAISWGSTFVLVQNAIKDIPTFTFLAIRFFFAFLFMFIIFFKKITFDINSLKASVLLGLFNFLAYSTQTYALYYTASSIVAFITGLNVVLVPIIAFFIFKKRISVFSVIGVILAATGIYFLTLNNNLNGIGLGEILTFICAVFVALHINYTDIFSKKYNIYTLVTFQFLTISIFSLIFIPFEKNSVSFSINVISALIITIFFATIFAFLVQTYAQKFTTPTKTAVIFAMEPVSAAIFGYFNHEILTKRQILGAIFVVTAMIVAEAGGYIFKKN